MRFAALTAFVAIMMAALLWACSSEPTAPAPDTAELPQAQPEGATPSSPDEMEPETDPTEATTAPNSAPTTAPAMFNAQPAPTWPLLEEFKEATQQAIAVAESGDADALMATVAAYGPLATNLAAGQPTPSPSDMGELLSIQSDLAEIISPLEKDEVTAEEFLAILRQVEALLDSLTEAAGIE